MAIFRQFIAPLLIFLTFLIALLAVSARIFLPADMAQPAPVEDPTAVGAAVVQPSLTLLPLVQGLEAGSAPSAQL